MKALSFLYEMKFDIDVLRAFVEFWVFYQTNCTLLFDNFLVAYVAATYFDSVVEIAMVFLSF